MLQRLTGSTFVVFTALIISISAFGHDTHDIHEIIGPERELTPAETHSILAKLKAHNLEKRWAAQKLLSAAEQSDFEQTTIDALFYDVNIRVDISTETIYGDVKNVYESLVDGMDTIVVDFDATLTVDSIYTDAGNLNFGHSGMLLTIELDKAYNTGEIIDVNIVYHGHPTEGGFQAFRFSYRSDGSGTVPVVSSLSEPYFARTWWPCKDRPDDKADSMDILITCDTAYFCASNGNMIDTTRNGDGTWSFEYEVRYPITTYLFSIAISNYTIWKDYFVHSSTDSMEIIHHVYPDKLTNSYAGYNVTPDALVVFTGLFGEYPFLNEKYGHANFEWGGGMEHQTCASMSGSWFGFYEPTVLHELGHQWYGNMITCESWHDIWLNEGFASYSEALYYEVAVDKDEYHSYMNGMAYSGPLPIYVSDTTSTGSIFNSAVYDKGAWLLHMLRHVVGDATFFDILEAYYNSAAQHSHANTQFFVDLCETVSGMELSNFFDDWLYGRYRPNYLFEKFSEFDSDLGQWITYLRLRQAQTIAPLVFRMPVDFVISYASPGLDTVVIDQQVRDSIYTFTTDEEPVSIELDPDDWILKYAAENTWKVHFIPKVIKGGMQYEAYSDTLIAKGGNGEFDFEVVTGALPSGLSLNDTTGEVSGYPEESGEFVVDIRVTDANNAAYFETKSFTFSVNPYPFQPGDFNQDGNVDLLDILNLIDNVYFDAPDPADPNLGDVDQSCALDLLDILALIAYVYDDGPDPLMGCVVPW